MGNTSTSKLRLQQLGLSDDESAIFLCLLESPKTQLEVSRLTGIARSNVYRLVDGMMDKSIITEIITDKDKLLAAAQPEALELLVIEQEKNAEAKRDAFNSILPYLKSIKNNESAYSIKTYNGTAGLKQMLWNELKTKTEVVMFSCGNLDTAVGKRWAEKFRGECIARNLRQRAIENPIPGMETVSDHEEFPEHYVLRYIPTEVLPIGPEITIHDDTISIYNAWKVDSKMGTEIKNPLMAIFMRQVFEQYWSMAKPAKVQTAE